MVRRSGKSVGAEMAGGDGYSSDPNKQPRSFVGNDDQSIKESDGSHTSHISSATEEQETLVERAAYVTVPQQSEFGFPGGGLGLDSVVPPEETEFFKNIEKK